MRKEHNAKPISNRLATTILVASLTLGFFANLIFLGNTFGIQFSLFIIGIVTLINYASFQHRRTLTNSAITYSAAAIALAAMVAIRDSANWWAST